MKRIFKVLAVATTVILVTSFTIYNGLEVKGDKVLNTTQVPLQQKLVKVIKNDESKVNKMVKCGFVLQDVDVEGSNIYYTLVLY